MKNTALALVLSWLLAASAGAGALTPAEAESLRAEVAAITTATQRGDAEDLINLTHQSLKDFIGGSEAFAQVTRQSVEQLLQSGVKFVGSEVGNPTRTYSAGDEEVCFVPRITVMEIEGKKARSTTFMIAIRKIGHKEWSYLDGAGLRKHPELLYRLLPKLERGISLPLNMIEAL